MVNVYASVLDKTTEENTDVSILAARNLKDERNPQNTQGAQKSNDGCKKFATEEKDSIGNNILDKKESEVIIETKKVTLDLTDKTNEHSVRIAIENGRECDEKIKAVRSSNSTLSKIRKRLNPIKSPVNRKEPLNCDVAKEQSEVSVISSKPGCLSGRYGRLNLKAREAVSSNRLIPKSFKMQYSTIDDNKIANYNEDIIMKYWNSTVIKQTWGRRISQRLRHGIISRTFPIISLFLLGHYGFFALLRTNICPIDDASQKNDTSILVNEKILDPTFQLGQKTVQIFYQYFNSTNDNRLSHFCTNFASINHIWVEKEYSMTRIVTMLIGFYVGFIVRTWWQQVRVFPSIDSLCMAMESFICVDSGIDEDAVGMEVGTKCISIKQFKKDIARLFLLSWTMCLCRISKPLKQAFPTPKSLSEKMLLTTIEYNQLKTDTDDDCWLEKWSTPLLWINKMINSVGKDTKLRDFTGHLESGARFKDTKEISITIFKFKDHLQTLSYQYYFRIPDLMLQCISIALYFFIFLGIFAAQGVEFHPEDDRNLLEVVICHFPFYYCIKYILLIGWLMAAKDLQNPFGEDISDVPLPVVLDFEIWKASNMLFQKVPYVKDEEDKNGENDDFWDDTWHKKFETPKSITVHKLDTDEPEYPPSNSYTNISSNIN